VRLKCSDLWRAEQLRVNAAGVAGNPIVFGSYPDGCGNRPVLSGALTIAGWSIYSGNIYVADLSAGANHFGITGYCSDSLIEDNWFVLPVGDPRLSKVFTNPTASAIGVSLQPRRYLDLDQNPVSGVLVLAPFSSRVLIDDGLSEAIFANGFESGGLAEWSSATP
jgi:hypothetical protein